jgi:hypothetical protein
MARDWFPRNELRDKLGLSEPAVRALEKIAEFIEAQADIEAAQTAIAEQGDLIDAANTDIVAANAAINALDGRIDAYDALAPFVRQNQAARVTFTPYAGQTVSAGYVQAEAQATDDAVKALATVVDTLQTRLDTVNLLT